ncbi:hypothetical protein ABEF95_006879 [Exophiala dermatitidis]
MATTPLPVPFWHEARSITIVAAPADLQAALPAKNMTQMNSQDAVPGEESDYEALPPNYGLSHKTKRDEKEEEEDELGWNEKISEQHCEKKAEPKSSPETSTRPEVEALSCVEAKPEHTNELANEQKN